MVKQDVVIKDQLMMVFRFHEPAKTEMKNKHTERVMLVRDRDKLALAGVT
jgi:hypothetical protein